MRIYDGFSIRFFFICLKIRKNGEKNVSIGNKNSLIIYS